MKIVELILDETQEMMGIDAISIVESPAIQEDFVALNSQEIKLAEVSKEKKILMGALLVPNKPIYRKNGDDEYYIFFKGHHCKGFSVVFKEWLSRQFNTRTRKFLRGSYIG